MSDWLLPVCNVADASEHDRLGRKWLARAAGLRTARALGESDRMSVFAATVAAVAVAAVAVAAPPLLPSCCRRRRCRHAAPMSTAPPLGHAVRDLGSGGGRAFFARGWSLFCWELRWGSVGCSGTVRKHVHALCYMFVCCPPRPVSCYGGGVKNIVHSSGVMLKFGGLSVPMLSTNPPDPYSIAKLLICIITMNPIPKLDHPHV